MLAFYIATTKLQKRLSLQKDAAYTQFHEQRRTAWIWWKHW